MKKRYKIPILFLAGIAFYLILIQFQEYSYPNKNEINQRTKYLERVIREPLVYGSEIDQIGVESNEWILFSYSFTSFAFMNLAMHDTSYREQAVQNIETCIYKVISERVTSNYSIWSDSLLSDTMPEYSILYLGHLNMMLGCYRSLSKDTLFNLMHDKISASLASRYRAEPHFFLESYYNSIWVPDNCLAMASLYLHNHLTGSGYDVLAEEWIEHLKAHYIEPESGVLYTTVDKATGQAMEEPRGSMLGWSISFIYLMDPDFAVDLYESYKENFSSNYLLFRLFKERYKDNRTSMGDIDSGPIFLGYSIPANEFALGHAILAKDYKTARKLERLVNFGTRKSLVNDELKYEVRFVDMNISPMAEALVLYSLTITPWTEEVLP